MSWFRRRQQEPGVPDRPENPEATESDVDSAGPPSGEPDDALADTEEPQSAAALERRAEAAAAERDRAAHGPLDVSEVDDDVTRVDLGALRVPPREGMELRLEIDEKTQRVIAATITLAGSSVQLQAFAAPRTEGIWEDIRAEIGAQITKQGGTADEVPGSFGREIIARLPSRTPDGRTGHQVARFTGVDGPRWFLRAVFNGPAAVDETAAADLEEIVRGTVVVRGPEAMAPRDLLALKLPERPAQAEPASGTGEGGEGDGGEGTQGPLGPLDPSRRGPEITEIR